MNGNVPDQEPSDLSQDESLAGQTKPRTGQQDSTSSDHRAQERSRKPAESKFDALHRERTEAQEHLRQKQRDWWDRDVAAARRYINLNYPRSDSASLDRPALDDDAIMSRAVAYTDRETPLTDIEMDRLAVAMVRHHNDFNEAVVDVYYQDKLLGLHPFSEEPDKAHARIQSTPGKMAKRDTARDPMDTLGQARSLDKESAAPEITPNKDLANGPDRGR